LHISESSTLDKVMYMEKKNCLKMQCNYLSYVNNISRKEKKSKWFVELIFVEH
jgi:hypothetical protein